MKHYDSLDEFPLQHPDGDTGKKDAELPPASPEPEHRPVRIHETGTRHRPVRRFWTIAALIAGILLIAIQFMTWRDLSLQIRSMRSSTAAGAGVDSPSLRQSTRPYVHSIRPEFRLARNRNAIRFRISYAVMNSGAVPGTDVKAGAWLDSLQTRTMPERMPVIDRSIATIYPGETIEATGISGEIPFEQLLRRPFLHIAAEYNAPGVPRFRVLQVYLCRAVNTETVETGLLYSLYE